MGLDGSGGEIELLDVLGADVDAFVDFLKRAFGKSRKK